jgi:glycosyltransferase involved in cell wall biosynthesis
MNLRRITPLILTFDEEVNIGRTLSALRWADRVVVVDTFSTDRTLEIARTFSNVDIFQRPFDSFAAQCNFGLDQIRSEWVLSLDADYVCPPELEAELASLPDQPVGNGFRCAFRYCIHGKPLRGTLYPPRTVLYRKASARYQQDGHAHRVIVDGSTGMLTSRIDHDDRKSLDAWFAAQSRYAGQEAAKLQATPASELGLADRLRRRKWLMPLITPFYCLILKGGLLDGRAGLFYAFQRTYAELALSLKLLEAPARVSQHDHFDITDTSVSIAPARFQEVADVNA